MDKHITLSATIDETLTGTRLDKALALLFPDFSRSQLKQWIEEGAIEVNGQRLKPRDKVAGGEHVTVNATLVERENWIAQAIDLEVVYEDDAILVINKPVGLVAHPGAGNADSTLVNALLHHCPDLACLPRAGLVHRLDKETSGLLVVAKTLGAHKHLVDQLQSRSMGREYEAIVLGVLTGGGKVNQPIGRHPTQRTKQAVVPNGKPAVTHYRVIERFQEHTHIRLKLESGRTHQIRVHMAHIRHPLLGDALYGHRLKLPKRASQALIDTLRGFSHQALHAKKLTLIHPESLDEQCFEAPLPADFAEMLACLGEHQKAAENNM